MRLHTDVDRYASGIGELDRVRYEVEQDLGDTIGIAQIALLARQNRSTGRVRFPFAAARGASSAMAPSKRVGQLERDGSRSTLPAPVSICRGRR